MNLHGYLVREDIIYTSKEGREFADVFFAMMRYYAIKTSMNIAIEKEKHSTDLKIRICKRARK